MVRLGLLSEVRTQFFEREWADIRAQEDAIARLCKAVYDLQDISGRTGGLDAQRIEELRIIAESVESNYLARRAILRDMERADREWDEDRWSFLMDEYTSLCERTILWPYRDHAQPYRVTSAPLQTLCKPLTTER